MYRYYTNHVNYVTIPNIQKMTSPVILNKKSRTLRKKLDYWKVFFFSVTKRAH